MIIVSGAPRSGTSLLMSMLKNIGYEIVEDDKRPPDDHNPNGYSEVSKIGEKIQEDKDFFKKITSNQAIKIVGRYLKHIPESEKCIIIYSQRHWYEIWASQGQMANRPVTPEEKRKMVNSDFATRKKIENNDNFDVHFVSYSNFILNGDVEQLSFLEKFNKEKCLEIIDPNLYHNRQIG